MGRKSDASLAEDMIILCGGTEEAQRGIRALFRYFGGQLVYFPLRKTAGASAEKIRGVLTDAVGEKAAEAILDKLMIRFGGLQIYLPLERFAFREIIALEIFERCGRNNVSMNDLAREYNITANHAYNLWEEGQREKLKPSMPFLPFLELAENNNHD
jgi:Mor family transcriptional regulator